MLIRCLALPCACSKKNWRARHFASTSSEDMTASRTALAFSSSQARANASPSRVRSPGPRFCPAPIRFPGAKRPLLPRSLTASCGHSGRSAISIGQARRDCYPLVAQLRHQPARLLAVSPCTRSTRYVLVCLPHPSGAGQATIRSMTMRSMPSSGTCVRTALESTRTAVAPHAGHRVWATTAALRTPFARPASPRSRTRASVSSRGVAGPRGSGRGKGRGSASTGLLGHPGCMAGPSGLDLLPEPGRRGDADGEGRPRVGPDAVERARRLLDPDRG